MRLLLCFQFCFSPRHVGLYARFRRCVVQHDQVSILQVEAIQVIEGVFCL
jgi:hypothetical protein